VVSGYLDLLARRYEGKLDEQADMFISYALGAVDRMQALIAGLLDYARLTTGEPVREDVDVAVLLRGVLDDLERRIDDVSADIAVQEPLPVVRGDSTQLGRVFQNLLSNALKFAKSDRPQVRVSATRNDSTWCFTVADNGIGVAAEDRARIFAMFERLHSRDDYAGTGLGLAICQRVVERHGGRIWVDDAPDGGSAFHFTIPST
jgi:signal transduction histidine kinase